MENITRTDWRQGCYLNRLDYSDIICYGFIEVIELYYKCKMRNDIDVWQYFYYVAT
jgi:hypothetical protein